MTKFGATTDADNSRNSYHGTFDVYSIKLDGLINYSSKKFFIKKCFSVSDELHYMTYLP